MVLRSPLASARVAVLGLLAGVALGACSSGASGEAAGRAPATSGAAGTAAQLGGAGGVVAAAAGVPASGGSLACPDCGTQGGAGSGGTGNGGTDIGLPAGSGSAASAGAPSGGGGASAGSGAAGSPSGGSSGGPPSNCGLPTPVSFQKNIQAFLTASCGKAVSGGCHVTDTSKTSLGYDHAYDWITAIAHTASCGKTQPYVKRFEVVLAVIAGANPASCPNSRQMPPASMGAPLTSCQVAALQAWLAEPMVLQTHVPETDDTKDLYPPGPYLMPPFN